MDEDEYEDEEEDEFVDELIVENYYEEDEGENGEKGGRTSSLDDIVHSEDERLMMDHYGHLVKPDPYHQAGAPHYMPVNTNMTMDRSTMHPQRIQKSSSLMYPRVKTEGMGTQSHQNLSRINPIREESKGQYQMNSH